MNWRKPSSLFLLILSLCTACGQQRIPSDPTERSMDTYITMQAYGEEEESALEEAEQLICQLERQLSVTDSGSEICAANHSGGEPVIVGADTLLLISFALTMARETNGVLNPTIYPVLTSWGFTTEEYHVPTQSELDELLPLVNYERRMAFRPAFQQRSQPQYCGVLD